MKQRTNRRPLVTVVCGLGLLCLAGDCDKEEEVCEQLKAKGSTVIRELLEADENCTDGFDWTNKDDLPCQDGDNHNMTFECWTCTVRDIENACSSEGSETTNVEVNLTVDLSGKGFGGESKVKASGNVSYACSGKQADLTSQDGDNDEEHIRYIEATRVCSGEMSIGSVTGLSADLPGWLKAGINFEDSCSIKASGINYNDFGYTDD